MKFSIEKEKLPQHIAFIMDGNGRWASKRLLPRKVGHRQGVISLKKLLVDIYELEIPIVSVYAFSTENKLRPEDEIRALEQLFKEFFSKNLDELIKEEIKISIMGDVSCFDTELNYLIEQAIIKTSIFENKVLNIGLNYGSRNEILRAVNLAVKHGIELKSEKEFEKLLYTSNLPDPDIVVRTGKECRLSNFMMYQAAYSELFFLDDLWPDVGKKQLYKILEQYSKRNRRFGKVGTDEN